MVAEQNTNTGVAPHNTGRCVLCAGTLQAMWDPITPPVRVHLIHHHKGQAPEIRLPQMMVGQHGFGCSISGLNSTWAGSRRILAL